MIIVGTFLDCLNVDGRKRHITLLRDEISTQYMRHGYPKIAHVIEVSGKTGDGMEKLEEVIYTVATSLEINSPVGGKEKLIGRKVQAFN